MTRLVLVVAAAIFDADGQVLLARRPAGKPMAGLWEFPGGKVDPGETPEAALARELHEELAIRVNPSLMKPLTFASFAYPDFHLLMPLYACREWSGIPAPREHQDLAWVEVSALPGLESPAADVPLFDFLATGRHQEP